MRWLSKLLGAEEEEPPPETQQLVKLTGTGDFLLNVVGESFYQDTLENICGGRTEDGENLIVDAILFHQDSNPHDDMAIAVTIKGDLVGHLSRENARQYRQKLMEAGFAGHPAVCKAKVIGGWDRGGNDRGHFGVKLDLPISD